MEGSIIFYTYGSTLELNGQQFEAGRLTEDLLNLSPDDYHPCTNGWCASVPLWTSTSMSARVNFGGN